MTDPVGGWSPAYCASKTLLNSITRHLAFELSSKNISVSAVCPGWVLTDKKILSNFKETPGLHIIADRQKKFYRLYHSQFLLKKLFSLASWRVTFASIFKDYLPHFNKFGGGVLGIPSDFLLDKNGIIADLHYGQHFGDSWTVSEVISKGQLLGD